MSRVLGLEIGISGKLALGIAAAAVAVVALVGGLQYQSGKAGL